VRTRVNKKKDPLEDHVPSYGLEALVSSIDDKDKLAAALKAASDRESLLNRQPDNNNNNDA
jgi:hypothetical protein